MIDHQAPPLDLDFSERFRLLRAGEATRRASLPLPVERLMHHFFPFGLSGPMFVIPPIEPPPVAPPLLPLVSPPSGLSLQF